MSAAGTGGRRALEVALGVLLALALPRPGAAAGLFVDGAVGDDAGDGLSWATARATIGSALATAATTPEPDVISVADGRYLEQLVVPADTTLLGGFPSGGGPRDPSAHPTVIDADLGPSAPDAPAVHFPPGSDGTVLDGFVVRGGRGLRNGETSRQRGGGVLVEDSAPVIRGNVVEDNAAFLGAGIALTYTSARPIARVEDNLIRRNSGNRDIRPCERGDVSRGGGVFVAGPVGVDLGVVLARNRVIDNEACEGGGVFFEGQGAIEHLDLEGNLALSAMHLEGGPIQVFDVGVNAHPGSGIELACGGTYQLANVTLAGNSIDLSLSGVLAPTAVNVSESVLWSETPVRVHDSCSGAMPEISSSIVRGGYPGGTDILDADPLLVVGPHGDLYLSHVSAGQPATSPAVDAGSVAAADLGLDARTTATDSAPDAGTLDLGHHYPIAAALTVLRGTTPDALTPHRTVVALPFVDDAGTLSDPALPRLFYEVPEAPNDVRVSKDASADAVRLEFGGER